MRRQQQQILSIHNPKIKAALALSKQRERKASGLFLIEGAREIERAMRSHYEVEQVFYCPEVLSASGYSILGALKAHPQEAFFYELGSEAFAKLAVREGSDGVLVVAKQKFLALEHLMLPVNPLILAMEAVEKPGNLGALLRSADGAGVDAVVVLEPTVDIYNQHVIRASLGTVFKIPVVVSDIVNFRSYCQKKGILIFAAALTPTAADYTQLDYTQGCAFLLGSEAQGLSHEAIAISHSTIQIPMSGIADSLNVATAGAVLMYEARRQRILKRTTIAK